MNQPKKASVSSIPMPAANDTDVKNRMKRRGVLFSVLALTAAAAGGASATLTLPLLVVS